MVTLLVPKVAVSWQKLPQYVVVVLVVIVVVIVVIIVEEV